MWKSRRLTIALAVLLAAQPALAAPAARTPLGAASPQAVVARLLKAGETKNVAEIFACMDPQSRLEGTTALLMGATMMLAFMDMGAGMGAAMAEGMAEAFSEDGAKPEDKAKLAKGKAEAAAKAAELKKKYSTLLKKHGLPDLLDEKAGMPEEGPDKLLAKIDQPAFAADVLAFFEQLGDKEKKEAAAGTPDIPKDVKDYQIQGDRATAKSGTETIEFVKVDGAWYFKPSEKRKADEKE
jgi:hypothetical protein